jgi:hypothetical protein
MDKEGRQTEEDPNSVEAALNGKASQQEDRYTSGYL